MGKTVAGLSGVHGGAVILALILVGCIRDEYRTPPEEDPRNRPDAADVFESTRDFQGDLDRAEERLRDSPYPLTAIDNPDPNQYGADGGRALRCDVVGVDLFLWAFDDAETAREAGELWGGEVVLPLRWVAVENLLLVTFADDDFVGVSAEAVEELFAILRGNGP